MPDYFIPLDTMRYTKYYRDLSAKGAIINASLKYIDKNRKNLKKKYPSFDDYKRDFEIPQSLIKAVFSEGEKGKVKAKDDKEEQATISELELQLKALIARDLWDMSEYFAIMYEKNPFVTKALELLSSENN
jgi:carboxyl-terminal processing protease